MPRVKNFADMDDSKSVPVVLKFFQHDILNTAQIMQFRTFLGVFLLGILAGPIGCGSNPPSPKPAVKMTRLRRVKAIVDTQVMPTVNESDFWVRELNDFMTVEEAWNHLGVHPEERLKTRYRRLTDIMACQQLYRANAGKMSPAQRLQFRDLVRRGSGYQELERYVASLKR